MYPHLPGTFRSIAASHSLVFFGSCLAKKLIIYTVFCFDPVRVPIGIRAGAKYVQSNNRFYIESTIVCSKLQHVNR